MASVVRSTGKKILEDIENGYGANVGFGLRGPDKEECRTLKRFTKVSIKPGYVTKNEASVAKICPLLWFLLINYYL